MTEGQTSYWPSPSVLTARLRRLITASQRYTKSRQILHIHQTQSQSQPQQAMMLSAPICPLPPALKDTLNPKMAAKIERQQRSGSKWNAWKLKYWQKQKSKTHVTHEDSHLIIYLNALLAGGQGEKRPIFIGLCPLLVSFLTRTSGDLTGPSSGPWPGCTRKRTRACRNTSAPSLLCVDECVACHPKMEVRILFA